MPDAERPGQSRRHLDLLGRLLHRIATLIIVVVSLHWSIPWTNNAYCADLQCRPNIVLILADELGYYEPGFMGGRTIRTPNLDRLAVEGMRFTNMFAGTFVGNRSPAAINMAGQMIVWKMILSFPMKCTSLVSASFQYGFQSLP